MNRLWLRLDCLMKHLESITQAYMSIDRATSIDTNRRVTRSWTVPVCMQDVLDDMLSLWAARSVDNAAVVNSRIFVGLLAQICCPLSAVRFVQFVL
jgi:hypothetical protein